MIVNCVWLSHERTQARGVPPQAVEHAEKMASFQSSLTHVSVVASLLTSFIFSTFVHPPTRMDHTEWMKAFLFTSGGAALCALFTLCTILWAAINRAKLCHHCMDNTVCTLFWAMACCLLCSICSLVLAALINYTPKHYIVQ